MLLSVIVPVYNGEKYLRPCIDSLVGQTYEKLEIILVNDGSSDKSGEICDEYKEKYENIKVIHKENAGVTMARYDGIAVSKGEYVTFVDCDDWVDGDMYSFMMGKIREYACDGAACLMIEEKDNGPSPHKPMIREGFYDKKAMEEKVYPRMLFDFEQCMPGLTPSLCNKIFSRDILERVVRGVNTSIVYGEDALCTYPTLTDMKSLYITEKAFYHYRKHTLSVTHTYDETLLDKFLVLAEEMKKSLAERGLDCTEQLSGYVARYSLECLRSELLFSGKKFREKYNKVRGYIEKDFVRKCYKVSAKRISDKKTRNKMKLLLKKRVGIFYALCYCKYLLLKIRGEVS